MGFGLVVFAVPGELLSVPPAGLAHRIAVLGERQTVLINAISLRQSISREEVELK